MPRKQGPRSTGKPLLRLDFQACNPVAPLRYAYEQLQSALVLVRLCTLAPVFRFLPKSLATRGGTAWRMLRTPSFRREFTCDRSFAART